LQGIVGQTARESEITRRVDPVHKVKPDPALIGPDFDDMPAPGDRQAIGKLNRMLTAMPSRESSTRGPYGQDAVNVDRRKGILRDDGRETQLGRPVLIETRMLENQVLARCIVGEKTCVSPRMKL
jgi:hypothetical protein